MKIFTTVIIVLAIGLIIFNLTQINYSAPLEGNSSVALVGVMASLCAIVLMLILQTSRKIAEKMKG